MPPPQQTQLCTVSQIESTAITGASPALECRLTYDAYTVIGLDARNCLPGPFASAP